MFVNFRSIAVAVAVISGFVAAQNVAAESTCNGKVIAYQFAGLFGPNVVSGPDGFGLHHEPFSITLYACEALRPIRTESDYSEYYPVELKGKVRSHLLVEPCE
jgi:hypothetical protein